MDKEIRTDTGLVQILHRPTEGETVSALLRGLGDVTQDVSVTVRSLKYLSPLPRITFIYLFIYLFIYFYTLLGTV